MAHLPSKPICAAATRVMLALVQVTKLKRDAINNVDAGGTRRGYYFGFGIMIKRELLAYGIARADIARIIHNAENQVQPDAGLMPQSARHEGRLLRSQ